MRRTPVPRAQLDAQFAGQLGQRLGHGARAAARIPDALLVCMWAMPQSTAGEASGAEPTYCVKWSSIWATRGSGTSVADALGHGLAQSASAARRPAVRGSNMRLRDRTCRTSSRSTARRRSGRRCRAAAPRGRGSCDSPCLTRRPNAFESSAPSFRASACRSRVQPSLKNDRHCGSSGTRSSSSSERRPASAKIRRSTEGSVRMVGPMSKRKPSSFEHGRLAAEPVALLEQDDRRSRAPPACRPPPGRPARRRSRRSVPHLRRSSSRQSIRGRRSTAGSRPGPLEPAGYRHETSTTCSPRPARPLFAEDRRPTADRSLQVRYRVRAADPSPAPAAAR